MRSVMTAALLAGSAALAPLSAAAQSPSLIEYFAADQAESGAVGAEAEAALAALKANPAVSGLAVGRLQAEAASAQSLSVPLPDRAGAINFNALTVETGASGERILSAEDGAGGSLTAVLTDGGAMGTLRTADGLYKLQSVAGGLTAIYRFDTSRLADHPETPRPPPQAISRGRARDDGAPETTETGLTRLDVIVAYSPDAAAEVPDMSALIALAIRESNDIYRASGIPAELNLVHSYQTAYNGTPDMAADLTRFRAKDDGEMDEVHQLRDRHAADLAVLIVATNKNACGYGYIDSAEDRAFSVVRQDCATGYYSFAHEIGHNLGAMHDVAAGRNAAYPYGHGFCNTRSGESGGWRTVMSYASDNCDDRLPIFSRADPVNGVRFGDAATMDNARVHRETIDRASRFRLADAGAVAGPGAGTGTDDPGGLPLSDTENFGVGGEAPKGRQRIIFD